MRPQRTRSQERVLRLLKQLNRSISAQDIYLKLRNRDENIGLATIYRSLEVLKIQGEVQARTLATGESLYSSLQKDQHHLTCVNCGKSIPIEECPVHDLEQQLEKSEKFKIYYHTLEFFGLCYKCKLEIEF